MAIVGTYLDLQFILAPNWEDLYGDNFDALAPEVQKQITEKVEKGTVAIASRLMGGRWWLRDGSEIKILSAIPLTPSGSEATDRGISRPDRIRISLEIPVKVGVA